MTKAELVAYAAENAKVTKKMDQAVRKSSKPNQDEYSCDENADFQVCKVSQRGSGDMSGKGNKRVEEKGFL